MTSTEHAEHNLLEWQRITRDRDARILQALQAGLTKHRIHQLTGVSRNTIEAVLKEHPVIDTAAVLRARARTTSGMTAPEFDYSLSIGDGRAVSAMNHAAYLMANEGHPEVQPGDDDEVLRQRRERADALWERVWPEVEAMTQRAKAMGFTGWSDAAKARGQKIAYAN
ncbi:hypothetical protein JOF41_007333 [Saccharothrix coeruleofusca]|uniref:hypothetical protein n=1 Tax=Saccharothrix coeruleofusca TaxID=33919 RepID=UPI001AE376AE|nr:hypothetical protein [Saccharothrix coeruleofusca]MBP2341079.1 hypothetical protein [Saccharothrix coeruleofusca]